MVTRIVLDPGHGGWDPGAMANGITEKDYQLAIGLRLRDALLARYDDVEVRMTRETDASVDPAGMSLPPGTARLARELQARVNIANGWPDSVLISLHNDAAGDSRARGGTIYVYGPQSWVAAVAPDGKINHRAPRSYQLAQAMEPIFREMLAKHGIPCNGTKAGDFQVLRNTAGRAVLVEAFFSTSPLDAAAAKTEAFKADLTDAYCRMIAAALGLREKAPATTNPRPVRVVLPSGKVITGELRDSHTWIEVGGVWCPLRAWAELLGFEVLWDNNGPTATVRLPK